MNLVHMRIFMFHIITAIQTLIISSQIWSPSLILVKLIKHRRCTKHGWISVNTHVMNISGKRFYSMRKTLIYYIVKLHKKKHDYQMELEHPQSNY